jgi:SAM-dependent methyltransferase
VKVTNFPHSSPYRDDLAYIHDAGFLGIAEAAAATFLAALACRGFRSGLVVDLGCGSGAFCEILAASGFDVLGVDLSEGMLTLARKRLPTGRFQHGSLFDVAFEPCVGVASVGECVNYAFDPENGRSSLASLFKRAHAALAPDGVFMLDALSPIHRAGRMATRSWRQGDDWAVLAESDQDPAACTLTRTITTFRKVGDLYRRDDEVHHVRLIEPSEIIEDLRLAGFRVRNLARYGDTALRPGHRAYLATKRRQG